MLFHAQVDVHWSGVAWLYLRMFLVSGGNRLGDKRSIDGDGLAIPGKPQGPLPLDHSRQKYGRFPGTCSSLQTAVQEIDFELFMVQQYIHSWETAKIWFRSYLCLLEFSLNVGR